MSFRRTSATPATRWSPPPMHLDAFLEGKKDLVPWGYPCNRTEGGAHTGNGSPTDSCDVGVPSGVNIANRRFIVDETIGSVVVYCTFGAGGPGGGSGAPDTHLFRIENGKLRYVHTLTHLLQANFKAGVRAAGLEAPTQARRRILRAKKKDPRSDAGAPSVSRRFLKESRHADGL